MELLGIRHRFLIGFISFNLLLVAACHNQQEKKIRVSKENRPATTTGYKKPPSSYQDTLRISGRSAVFFRPDSLQAIQIRNSLGDQIYESDEHESIYLLRNTRNVINKSWPGITLIESKAARYLLFKKWNNTTLIDLDQRNQSYGLFLFDPRQEPRLADMANIDTELANYYRNN